MAGNSIGDIFRVTTFGESHGIALGVVIDGCPSGFELDLDFIADELKRRKPGQSSIVSSRNETEEFEILSGVFEGKTTGAPLSIIVRNNDAKPEDYENIKDIFRPSHADYTYYKKYGVRDHRGGGRQSARETISRVLAGAVAKQFLNKFDIRIDAFVSQVYDIKLEGHYAEYDLTLAKNNNVRCPDEEVAKKMQQKILDAAKEGDSLGGIITCVCKNVPIGLGEPVFEKLNAEIGKAILSINACKGIDFGSGFDSVLKKGSELNDEFVLDEDRNVKTKTNNSGGIQGGISNGEDIYFKAVFKPVASISKMQKSLNILNEEVSFKIKGRHDSCVVPRAVAIVEAMTAIVILNYLLGVKSWSNNSL